MRLTNNQKADKLALPLCALLVLLLLIVFFILGVATGANFQNHDSIIGGSISDWITATATTAVTALTFVLAKESWQLRLLQTAQTREFQLESIRPNVTVHLENSPVSNGCIDVKISNSGKGIARNVVFTFTGKSGEPLLENQDEFEKTFKTISIFRNGIKSIGVNQTISSFLFSFADLNKDTNGNAFAQGINLLIDFQDTQENKYKNELSIDLSEFEGISEIKKFGT